MNISSLYLDHSVFSGHTCGGDWWWVKHLGSRSATMVILSCCTVALNHSLLLELQFSHWDVLLAITAWKLYKVSKPSCHHRGLNGKMVAFLRHTPPCGCNKQAWDCLCQRIWLFWQQRWKAHTGFGQPREKSDKMWSSCLLSCLTGQMTVTSLSVGTNTHSPEADGAAWLKWISPVLLYKSRMVREKSLWPSQK